MSNVRVGLLHPCRGNGGAAEASLIEAERLAIAQINQAGGILGQFVEPIVRDGIATPTDYARTVRKLIRKERVAVIFGGGTSAFRRAALPVLEAERALLWYPLTNEGGECSPNIFYVGACPNQLIEPALTWLLHDGGKRLYLVGTNDRFSHAACVLMQGQLHHRPDSAIVGKAYFPSEATTFTDAIARIQQAKPDFIVSTLESDSHLAFTQQYREGSTAAPPIPLLALRGELQPLGGYRLGHYCQSPDTPSNRAFIEAWQQRSTMTITPAVEAAYTQVYLWKQAVELADSFAPERVRAAAYGLVFEAPGGTVQIQPNHHVARACHIEQVLPTGEVRLIYTSKSRIQPLPWLGLAPTGEPALEQNPPGETFDDPSVASLDFTKRQTQPTNDQGRMTNDQIASLHRDLETLQREKADLETLLEITTSHADTIETELHALNEQLQGQIAERHRIEEELRHKEQVLRLILDNIPQQIFWKDTNLVFQGCNKNWAKTAQLESPEAVVGKTDYDLLPSREMAEEYRSRDRRVMQTNTPECHAIETKKKNSPDGKKVWLDVNRVPIHDAKGNVVGVLGALEDITARKQAEEALKESQRRLRNQNAVLLKLTRNKALYRGKLKAALREITEVAARTLEIERASIWLYDETGSKLQCMDLFERSVERHYSGAELAARDYPAYFKALEADRTLTTHDASNDFRTRDYAESYLDPLGIKSTIDAPIRLGGHTIGVVCLEQVGVVHHWTLEEQNFAGSIADLASLALEARERKRTELALQRAEEKYRSIFENAAEGIFQTTPEGCYLSANPALARMFGYASPEALIADMTDIERQLYVNPKRRSEFVAAIEKDRSLSDFESRVYRCDGSIIWISENARVVRDDQGRLLYYEGTVEDITKRRQAEEALRQEKEKSESLLLNILPQAIAQQLKQSPEAIAEQFNETTILFADIVDFTPLASRMSATELVNLLNQIFSAFDQLVERHGLEKIKTIGDAYMVAGGLPTPRSDHAEAVARLALEMQQEITRFQRDDGEPFRLRIGINTGSVVAGVIGIKKFIYDLWGDAVNIASRMESQGDAGGIQVTATTYEHLKEKYRFQERGTITVKGRGEMKTYWLLGKRESGTHP